MAKNKNDALAANPLSDEQVLAETFFISAKKQPEKDRAKPEHYKICCISLYNEDIARLDSLVAELKKRGHSKANKSMVIRYALAHVDLDNMPKGY